MLAGRAKGRTKAAYRVEGRTEAGLLCRGKKRSWRAELKEEPKLASRAEAREGEGWWTRWESNPQPVG